MNLARELMEQFEYALPLIKASVEEVRLRAARDVRGSFEVRNGGGGTLEGTLVSDQKGMAFSPADFSGNKVMVEYRLALGDYKPGDEIVCKIIILSNGGELSIPVHVTVTPRSLTTDDGVVLATPQDFLAYAQANLVEAARAFARKDFAEWLTALPGGVNMELYEHLKFDANKERAVDNFLVCHGLKERGLLSLETDSADITVQPGQKDMVNGVVGVLLSEWGFVEATAHITTHAKEGAPWLRLITSRLTSQSFDKNGAAYIDYVINPTLLGGSRAYADISVKSAGQTLTHRLFVKTLPVLGVNLNKNAFLPSDNGKVVVENNTGADMVVEVMPKHDFIRFEGKRYLIGGRADVPFEVRLAPNRLPAMVGDDVFFIRSEILIKTIHNGNLFTRTLEIGVGPRAFR